MPYYCFECAGELGYDSNVRIYTCKSCGLTLTFQQLTEEREKLKDSKETQEDVRKRRHKEYLQWWLSKK